MRRALAVAGAVLLPGAWWLANGPTEIRETLGTPPRSSLSPADGAEIFVRIDSAGGPPLDGAARYDARLDLPRVLPATSEIGRRVQQGLATPGATDARLLDAMSHVGLSPGGLALAATWIDPWLGVGLVDLERQIAARCEQGAAQGRSPWPISETTARCREAALAAEVALASALADHPAGVAASVLHAHDTPSTCEAQTERLDALGQGVVRADVALLGPLSTSCPLPARGARDAILATANGTAPWNTELFALSLAIRTEDAEDAVRRVERLVERPDVGPRRMTLRAHVVARGWSAPLDWREAVAAALVVCGSKEPSDARWHETLEFIARPATVGDPLTQPSTLADAGAWHAVSGAAACVVDAIHGPTPTVATRVVVGRAP